MTMQARAREAIRTLPSPSKTVGWQVYAIATVLVSIAATLGFVYANGLDRVGAGSPGNSTTIVVPASGIEGFPVEAFCQHTLTKVQALPAPDAGITYQLTRVLDNVSETVTVVTDPAGKVNTQFSRHYYDTTVGQDSQPAVVTDAALKCIKDKAR